MPTPTPQQPTSPLRRSREAWLAGVRARLNGAAFGTNPYAPAPVLTRTPPRDLEAELAAAWSKGYWWLDRAHRGGEPGR